MFNDELTLISYEIAEDNIGNQKKNRVEKTVLCDIQSTTRNEFYNYGDSELRPEYIALMNEFEYENEPEALFRGEQYVITRTYLYSRDLIELTLSRGIQR